MQPRVDIIGAGLAGSEAALQLASRGFQVRLFEMRPFCTTAVHTGSDCAELVCSNSLKSLKPQSAAGMLKHELTVLGSEVLSCAFASQVPAGGALAVDRHQFSQLVTQKIMEHPDIELVIAEVVRIDKQGCVWVRDESCATAYCYDKEAARAVLLASGPLTSDSLANSLTQLTGADNLAFYDAAAPIVLADSLDYERVFSQSRYEQDQAGDYLNAPFTQSEYEAFIEELIHAEGVIKKDFETKELFQACQPIEEIARRGKDAPRFGPMKPVGLTDPQSGRRPWAVLQLRAEDKHRQSYNLVGFQTNLTFSEQKRVFRMIPGLEQAEFARFGVMHRNTFINAPQLLDASLRMKHLTECSVPVFVAGQLSGTEGYCEAIATGLVSSLGIVSLLAQRAAKSEQSVVLLDADTHECEALRDLHGEEYGVPEFEPLPPQTALGSLLAYATSEQTLDYQPMHVNFGIIAPLDVSIKNKQQRYGAYAQRGTEALEAYVKRNAHLFNTCSL